MNLSDLVMCIAQCNFYNAVCSEKHQYIVYDELPVQNKIDPSLRFLLRTTTKLYFEEKKCVPQW